MAGYRLYLRDAAGIVGRDDFDASDDEAALGLADLLLDACSDTCDRYELWQRMRLVRGARQRSLSPPIAAAEIAIASQASLIAREEAIQNSTWAVARSKRLLQRLNALKSPS